MLQRSQFVVKGFIPGVAIAVPRCPSPHGMAPPPTWAPYPRVQASTVVILNGKGIGGAAGSQSCRSEQSISGDQNLGIAPVGAFYGTLQKYPYWAIPSSPNAIIDGRLKG